MRTAIITKIKGLSIQTQQNTFLLFTLFKLTLDERKTLTKISTRKTSHNRSPKPAHTSDDKETGRNPPLKGKQQVIQKRAICIIGRESKALGFHQETTEESRTQQNWFCIKLYIILYQTSFIVLENLISTKHYFQRKKKIYYKFQLQNSKFKTLFSM